MKILDISDERVFTVWNQCVEVYLQHGRKLSFPQHTDPRKTYQWRYARALAIKFEEWEFDEDTAMSFIRIAVTYAKNNNRLNKGLAALHQGNLLQLCYDELKKSEDNNNNSISSIEIIKQWIDRQIGDKDPVLMFLKRKNPDAFCNIFMWVQATKISPLYLSLSKSCGKALARLAKQHPHERNMLPKSTELFRIRSRFLDDLENKKRSKIILERDWRDLCP